MSKRQDPALPDGLLLAFYGDDFTGSTDTPEAVSPLARGSPICRTYSTDPRFDGMELVLKGGQVGDGDFFIAAKAGTTDTARHVGRVDPAGSS